MATHKKKKSNYIQSSDPTVYSTSSGVDREPKMTKEERALEKAEERAEDKKTYEEANGQQTFLPPASDPDAEIERLAQAPAERKFKVELKLSLTPAGDKSFAMSVVAGEYPSSRVLEILGLSLTSRRIKKIIEAVLDNPIVEQKEALVDTNPLVKEASKYEATKVLGAIGQALETAFAEKKQNGVLEGEHLNGSASAPGEVEEPLSEVDEARTADGETLSEANAGLL